MKKYYRIMLGKKHTLAEECYQGKWFGEEGVDFSDSLENQLAENYKDFNSGTSAPQIIATNPDIEDLSVFALEEHL